ncbi:MAG: DNA recombination protein RmuC [bacterium]
MGNVWIGLIIAAALLAGGIIGWVLKTLFSKTELFKYRDRTSAAEALVKDRESTIAKADEDFKTFREQLRQADEARVAAETRVSEIQIRLHEQISLIEKTKQEFTDAFKTLADEALSRSTSKFLTLAEDKFKHHKELAVRDLEDKKVAIEGLVRPLGETLSAYQKEIRALEEKHITALTTVNNGIREQAEATSTLQAEAANLVSALREPLGARARWGEITLKRVVELAGMSAHCDFSSQETVTTEEGRRLRPDMVVKLPAGREVVVDAKTPLGGYLDALEARTDEERAAALKRYAQQVKAHVRALAATNYSAQFELAPEFIVMFLPNDLFFAAAVEQAPDLIEVALVDKVIITTPSTLIALLSAVAYGWRQEQVAENAQEICKLGQELSDRISTWAEHLAKTGSALDDAVESYNKAMRSLETRVLTQARRFTELGAKGKKDIGEVPTVDKSARALKPPEATS